MVGLSLVCSSISSSLAMLMLMLMLIKSPIEVGQFE